ncbi:MAG: MerR family transcriptional regulator [Sphingomonadaceae bacterium]
MSGPALSPLFSDGKAPGAMRTIGEVSKALGIRQHVLRYWEEQFPMLRPVKRSGGRRYYRPEDVTLIATIDRLVHKQGYTLRGARKAIEAGQGTAPAPAGDVSGNSSEIAELKAGLEAIRTRLSAALTRA